MFPFMHFYQWKKSQNEEKETCVITAYNMLWKYNCCWMMNECASSRMDGSNSGVIHGTYMEHLLQECTYWP